jgi:hypothetical protein
MNKAKIIAEIENMVVVRLDDHQQGDAAHSNQTPEFDLGQRSVIP